MSWPCVRLGELGDIVTGKTPSTFDNENFGGDIPFVTPSDLDSDEPISFTPRTITRKGAIAVKTVPTNSVLVCCIGSLGKVGFSARELATNQQINSVVFDEMRVIPRYGYHACRLLKPRLEAMAPATTVAIVSKSRFANIEILLPPLDEQKRIAAVLDEADTLCRLRQRAIDRLDRLGQAIFYEMFGDPKINNRGWDKTTLGAVASFYSGNSLPEGKDFEGEQDGHFLLKVADLNWPENSREIIRSTQWSRLPGSPAGTCPATAIVFPKRGGAIGTNKKRLLKRSAILDPNLMGVVPRTSVMHPEFLFAWFETFNLSDIASGSSVPQLNKQDLSPLEIYIPPSALQERFAEKMEELVGCKKLAARHLIESERLRVSLQYRAFRGEL